MPNGHTETEEVFVDADSIEMPEAGEAAVEAQRQAERVLNEAEVIAGTRRDLKSLEQAVKRTETFAKWMDSRMLDPILGLIPGIGDLPTAAAGLYIVAEAIAAGVPKGKILKMLFHIGIDAAAGVIPVIGDLFDFVYKSNKKNAAIFREYLEKVKAEA